MTIGNVRCQWSWKTRKRSSCPGVIRYEFGAWPAHLKTAGELSRFGMTIPSLPDGCYYQRLEPHWLWLYDECEAVHLRPSVSQYVTLLFRTNEKCQWCGCEVEDELDDPHIVDGLCLACRFEKDWIEQRNEIRAWAQASLHAHHTVLLNTETTGFGKTDTVIEIAVISAAEGTTLLNTRIQTKQPIQEAGYVSALSDSEQPPVCAPFFRGVGGPFSNPEVKRR